MRKTNKQTNIQAVSLYSFIKQKGPKNANTFYPANRRQQETRMFADIVRLKVNPSSSFLAV